MRWIDTKTEASFKLAKLSDGGINLVLIGLDKNSKLWADAVRVMHMRVSASGRTLFRTGAQFTLKEVLSLFPDATPVSKADSDIYLNFDNKKSLTPITNDERKARADMQSYIPLGLNYLKQEVFQSGDGTRFINAITGRPISETTAQVPAAFLRASEQKDMDLCADGFVFKMEDQMMRPEDIRRFASVVYGENNLMPVTDTRLRMVQEAIEAAIYRSFSNQMTSPSLEAFDLAVKLNNHQPVLSFRSGESIVNQQYSTPLTISVAAQYILGDCNSKKGLEPTIGNGSLISMLREAEIHGVEIDHKRANQVKDVFSGGVVPSVLVGDFLDVSSTLPADFDFVIANPPFGGLAKHINEQGLMATRLDHLITLRALSKRKDDGVAVFIVGADHENIYPDKQGQILGGSQRFFNWLNDHYEIDAIEITGDMYKKQGANYPVRLIAVKSKRNEEDIKRGYKTGEYHVDSLPIVRSEQELWDAAERLNAWVNKSPLAFFDKKKEVSHGEFQSQYIPLSNSGNSTAMIPVNLVQSQSNAFARLEKDIGDGDVDSFVKKELQMKTLDLFTPEQVDAIALSIMNSRRERGLILADQTGQGKGRVVAAIARYAVLNGRTAIFLTDTPNLFSDFWRDIKDIGSEELFKPFILNINENIRDISNDGEVIIPSTPISMQKKMIEEGLSPSDMGFNLALMTYSQFNREASNKSTWLKIITKDNYIILDEAHKAAGESNTARAVAAAVENSWSVTYSSATYAKDAKNMSIYTKAFPTSVNLATLSETLEAGGEPLQEVISSMLCDDGVLIRREHDLSRLKFSITNPSSSLYQRNREVADKIASVLSLMSYLSGDIEKVVNEVSADIRAAIKELPDAERVGNRMGVSSVNFGSKLYTIQRQLMLALAAETTVEESVAILKSGGKPVIAVEQTMETLIKELIGDDNDDIKLLEGKEITFRDLLGRSLNSILTISKRDAYGVMTKVSIFDLISETNAVDEGEKTKSLLAINKFLGLLTQQIRDLPYLSAMPLDVIKQGIENAGYSINEVSGRSFETRVDGKGYLSVIPMKIDRSDAVFKFNNGDYDATLITSGAAATGISLHASEKFADQRQRFLIEAQISNDVKRRVQLFGRVDRRGQVSVPEIRSITSGLPSETRVLAMQNMKLRAMSANTQSNRNNASEMKDIPDILNETGDKICKEFLFSNPKVAMDLGINLDNEVEDPVYFVNKLTGRIGLLPVSLQESIYDQLMLNYQQYILELNNLGINPFKSNILDVKAKTVEKFVLKAGRGNSSVFDAPVYAEKIEWKSYVDPIRLQQVADVARLGAESLIEKGYARATGQSIFLGLKAVDLTPLLKKVKVGFFNLAVRSLPLKFINEADPRSGIRDALNDKKDNIIKKIDERSDWFEQYGKTVAPGTIISYTSADGKKTGVVVETIVPDDGDEHLLGQWEIKVAVPGEQGFSKITFNQLYQDKDFSIESFYRASGMLEAFDSAPKGEIIFNRWLLSGNLFMAAELAAASSIGRAGVVTTEDGMHKRAIITYSSVDLNELKNLPTVFFTAEDALTFIRGELYNGEGEMNFGNGFKLAWDNRKFEVITPGSKKSAGMIFGDKKLITLIGEFAGSKKEMRCKFDINSSNKIEEIVRKFYNEGLNGRSVSTSHNNKPSLN